MKRLLYETEKLKFENEYENTCLVDKLTGTILLKDDFYGDPTCALIDKNNKWAIVAGEHLTQWKPDKTDRIDNENLKWIHGLRIKNENTVEILVDPWSNFAAIWEINIETFQIKKIKNFNRYKDQPFTENVEW